MDYRVGELVKTYRKAIDKAKDEGEFIGDCSFCHFPRGCCGDASYLLAEYLKKNGIETIWVSNSNDETSHAWLVIKDDRVTGPSREENSLPEEIKPIIERYGGQFPSQQDKAKYYQYRDIRNGLIIDITVDQFASWDDIYIGDMDSFHQAFRFIEAHDYVGLNDLNGRLERLYGTIKKYLKEGDK